ncbi:hypothetical protein OE398_32635 [Pseudomonas aeruginosa]|nr:hypothetical protein [Pseudomonas aeruginosa]MCU9167594.1 hypothetical protein [Pseudomonas aeruginosa]HCF6924833.1 hypothetical protein [Pseudomonas aeruginosa]
MSKVKRLNFTVSQFESVVPYASEHGQYVRYTDYAKLAAEAQALREEVAALRARVAVVPDPVTMDGTTTIREYVANAVPKDTPMDKWTQGYEECKRRIHAMFEQPCNKRPNGLTVSEGLLRRLCEPLLSHADYVVARNELRALLSEQA